MKITQSEEEMKTMIQESNSALKAFPEKKKKMFEEFICTTKNIKEVVRASNGVEMYETDRQDDINWQAINNFFFGFLLFAFRKRQFLFQFCNTKNVFGI